MERITDLLKRGEATLDGWGRPGWIGAMVLGFILAWPVGLALLFYMIWSGRMGRSCHHRERRWSRGGATGNAAFDDYKEATLRRLEEEQAAFEQFLERLRRAKDQSEFDQFMDERRRGAPARPAEPGPVPTAGRGPEPDPYAGPDAPQPA